MVREPEFVRVGAAIIPVDNIDRIDTSELLQTRLTVHLRSGVELTVFGQEAVDFVMRTRPESIEGRRFRHLRNAWAVHNLVGHPGLQILHWLGFTKLGLWLHDVTVPKPR